MAFVDVVVGGVVGLILVVVVGAVVVAPVVVSGLLDDVPLLVDADPAEEGAEGGADRLHGGVHHALEDLDGTKWNTTLAKWHIGPLATFQCCWQQPPKQPTHRLQAADVNVLHGLTCHFSQ